MEARPRLCPEAVAASFRSPDGPKGWRGRVPDPRWDPLGISSSSSLLQRGLTSSVSYLNILHDLPPEVFCLWRLFIHRGGVGVGCCCSSPVSSGCLNAKQERTKVSVWLKAVAKNTAEHLQRPQMKGAFKRHICVVESVKDCSRHEIQGLGVLCGGARSLRCLPAQRCFEGKTAPGLLRAKLRGARLLISPRAICGAPSASEGMKKKNVPSVPLDPASPPWRANTCNGTCEDVRSYLRRPGEGVFLARSLFYQVGFMRDCEEAPDYF